MVQNPQPTDDGSPEFDALRLSDVAPDEVRYLVEPYLPLGAFCLLEGDPGVGKSYVAADWGAALTRGRMPDLGCGEPRRAAGPRNVLYLSTEDAPKRLRARFEAQGADLDRVFCVPRMVNARDLSPLQRLLAKHRPALVVIDPVHALLDGTNMNSANTVRVALAPLGALAEKHGCAVLAIRHLAKAGRGRAIYRGLGSIDFSAVARSVLRLGEDPAQPGSRALVHVKNSYGAPGASLDFEITDRLTWLGRSELTSADLDAHAPRARGRGAIELVEAFLREQLERGPRLAKDVRAAAARAGFAERTLERAQKALGVLHERLNAGDARGRGQWVWALPSAHGRHEAHDSLR